MQRFVEQLLTVGDEATEVVSCTTIQRHLVWKDAHHDFFIFFPPGFLVVSSPFSDGWPRWNPGVNHGSLSERILFQYGDSPEGMVASAIEFGEVCRKHDFHNFIFSPLANSWVQHKQKKI